MFINNNECPPIEYVHILCVGFVNVAIGKAVVRLIRCREKGIEFHNINAITTHTTL